MILTQVHSGCFFLCCWRVSLSAACKGSSLSDLATEPEGNTTTHSQTHTHTTCLMSSSISVCCSCVFLFFLLYQTSLPPPPPLSLHITSFLSVFPLVFPLQPPFVTFWSDSNTFFKAVLFLTLVSRHFKLIRHQKIDDITQNTQQFHNVPKSLFISWYFWHYISQKATLFYRQPADADDQGGVSGNVVMHGHGCHPSTSELTASPTHRQRWMWTGNLHWWRTTPCWFYPSNHRWGCSRLDVKNKRISGANTAWIWG